MPKKPKKPTALWNVWKATGMTQEQFADAIGCDCATVRKLIKGQPVRRWIEGNCVPPDIAFRVWLVIGSKELRGTWEKERFHRSHDGAETTPLHYELMAGLVRPVELHRERIEDSRKEPLLDIAAQSQRLAGWIELLLEAASNAERKRGLNQVRAVLNSIEGALSAVRASFGLESETDDLLRGREHLGKFTREYRYMRRLKKERDEEKGRHPERERQRGKRLHPVLDKSKFQDSGVGHIAGDNDKFELEHVESVKWDPSFRLPAKPPVTQQPAPKTKR